MNFIKQIDWWLVLFITLVSALGVALLPGCSAGTMVNPLKLFTGGPALSDTPAGSAMASLNWMLPLSVIGVAASMFALVLPGVSKSFAFAGLAASGAAAVCTLILVKYAWLIAILGMLIGLLVVVNALTKHRKNLFGFIDGFQSAKERLVSNLDTPAGVRVLSPTEEMNSAMSEHLTPEARELVKKRKAMIGDD